MPLKEGSASHAVSERLRAMRDVHLRQLIERTVKSKTSVSIIDLGGTPDYWRRVGLDFLRERKARVTLVNFYASELSQVDRNTDLFEIEVGDACDLKAHADMSFDIAHSNSVIEHVHTWENMKRFASETRRLAPAYYAQTPYFWFPVDPHYYKFPFFHWLPRPIRARLLNALPLAHVGRIEGIDDAYSVVDASRLLDGRQFHFLFPDAQIRYERLLGFAKSMIAIKG